MAYRYIALTNERTREGERASAIEAALGEAGIRYRLTAGIVDLYAARETPTLLLADGSVIIGHLFSRDRTPITEGAQIPASLCNAKLRRHLLENYWGEYLLLQPLPRDDGGLAVTREPSGGVPCVYASIDNDGIFLTSDISFATAIGLYRRKIDWDYIACSLTYPNQKVTRTGLVDVSELLPGFTLRFTDKNLVTEQDWSPWDHVARERRYRDPRQAAIAVRESVASVVSGWAETDEAILLEMSGGLDSSVVAACLRDTSARVICCTLVTPVPGADERQYARLVAEQLGVDLRAIMLDFQNAQFCFTQASRTTSPRAGALQYAINAVMSDAGERHNVRSFFSGSGGDTVFCHLTNAAPAADAFKELGVVAGLSAIQHLSTLHQCTLWTAARLTLRKLAGDPKAPRVPHSTFVDSSIVADTPFSHPWFDAPSDAMPGDRERIFGLVDTLLYREMGPRGTHSWIRMPLLAQPVVETCLNIPSWMWIAEGQNRAIARLAFADALPTEILTRRSKGNFLGYLGGYYRRNRHSIRDFLLGGLLNEQRLLNAPALNSFFAREDLPIRDNLFLEVFDLCMIENWLRHQH